MSGRLVDEVFEHAPEDLTMPQLLVLLAIAEDAREADRRARYKTSNEDLARRTRRPLGVVRNAVSELVRRGLIKRVHDRVHRGGLHQEYVLAKLSERHRFATMHNQPTPPKEV